MSIMLINATQSDELRSVILDDSNKLINYDVDTPQQEQKKSNIYKAVITSIEPSLGALFVNFGSERTGFLPFSNISPEYYNAPSKDHRNPDLWKLFKIGQEVVVQVEKDERGSKGAALTTYISLAGSYVVLMPNNPKGGGISRQIEGSDRDNLRETLDKLKTPEGMSVIARTAGVGRTAEELQWDLEILLRYWDAIKRAAIAKPGPYLIHQESNVVLRSVRDNLREDIREVVIDDKDAFEQVYEYIKLVRPDFLDRIKLHNNPSPIFSYYQVEQQIEMAYMHEISLPSGGSIVIDHTEALISIDVNSAKATKGSNIEETAYYTNLEAAEEVARQLRIRDLGGLIVIDFIDMTPAQNRRNVENRLRESLKLDRARIQLERISRFGLLEMSRQRLRRPLSKTIKITCPRCEGQGMVRSVESLASTIIHSMEQNLAKSEHPLHFTIQAPTALATFLINERRDQINRVESVGLSQVTIIPNQYMHTPDYNIKVNELTAEHPSSSKQMASYKLIKQMKPQAPPSQAKRSAKTFDEPVINQYLSIPDAPPSHPGAGTGLFKRLLKHMFGEEEAEKQVKQKIAPQTKSSTSSTKKRSPQKNKQQSRRSGSEDRSSGRQDNRGRNRRTSGDRNRPAESARRERGTDNTERASGGAANRTRRGSRGGQRSPEQKDRTENRSPTKSGESTRNRRPSGNRSSETTGNRRPSRQSQASKPRSQDQSRNREKESAATPAKEQTPTDSKVQKQDQGAVSKQSERKTQPTQNVASAPAATGKTERPKQAATQERNKPVANASQPANKAAQAAEEKPKPKPRRTLSSARRKPGTQSQASSRQPSSSRAKPKEANKRDEPKASQDKPSATEKNKSET